MKNRVSVLFENSTLLALNKPSGVLSVPDRFHEDKPSMAGMVLQDFPLARPLHRLDFETSGVLLFCLQPDAFGWYSDQFEQRTVAKQYLALVEGPIREDDGVIDAPLLTLDTGRVTISRKGKPAQTEWHVEERFRTHTLVTAHPFTGRTHQIRVHLASIGHPVAVDLTYGAPGPVFLSEIKGKKRFKLSRDAEMEWPLLARLALHAVSLTIMDFSNREPLNIQAELPKDMRATIQQLRQWAKV